MCSSNDFGVHTAKLIHKELDAAAKTGVQTIHDPTKGTPEGREGIASHWGCVEPNQDIDAPSVKASCDRDWGVLWG